MDLLNSSVAGFGSPGLIGVDLFHSISNLDISINFVACFIILLILPINLMAV